MELSIEQKEEPLSTAGCLWLGLAFFFLPKRLVSKWTSKLRSKARWHLMLTVATAPAVSREQATRGSGSGRCPGEHGARAGKRGLSHCKGGSRSFTAPLKMGTFVNSYRGFCCPVRAGFSEPAPPSPFSSRHLARCTG